MVADGSAYTESSESQSLRRGERRELKVAGELSLVGLEVSHEVGGPGAVVHRLPLRKFSVDFLDFGGLDLTSFPESHSKYFCLF